MQTACFRETHAKERMEVLSWYVLLIPLMFSFRQLGFRVHDTGSERDGMQPHDGNFCSFFYLSAYQRKLLSSVRVSWM